MQSIIEDNIALDNKDKAIHTADLPQALPILHPGDAVAVIAPASRCTNERLFAIKTLLSSWQLEVHIDDAMFGDDLLCAHSDDMRFYHLKQALYDPNIKAVICARGGYGSSRLLPKLAQMLPSEQVKLFVGMSDITALHLFLQQVWHWPVLHAACSMDTLSPQAIAAFKAALFGTSSNTVFTGIPLNEPALQNIRLEASITGGNLSIIQTSIGTTWQMSSKNKIILLEEVNERAYRVDRMLTHLTQTGLFQDAQAIILGDFLGGNEPDGTTLMQPVLERFAKECLIPVIQIANIGHGDNNLPIPMGTPAQLICGKTVQLMCE